MFEFVPEPGKLYRMRQMDGSDIWYRLVVCLADGVTYHSLADMADTSLWAHPYCRSDPDGDVRQDVPTYDKSIVDVRQVTSSLLAPFARNWRGATPLIECLIGVGMLNAETIAFVRSVIG
jgi:hypothetical protein